MRKPTIGAKTWICIIVGILALVLWSPIETAVHVAAVQNAVQRDWEIYFGDSPTSPTEKPRMLPASLDTMAATFFDRIYADTIGYDGQGDPKTRNRNHIARERFRALFRGAIENIDIYDFEGFRGNLGAALTRFPELRRLSIEEFEPSVPSEAEWTLLCKYLRDLPNLDEVELAGSWITDEAIAPLRGHPKLRKITVLSARLTAQSTDTFRSLPHLTFLHIEGQIHSGDAWLSPEEIAGMKEALPGVDVELAGD